MNLEMDDVLSKIIGDGQRPSHSALTDVLQHDIPAPERPRAFRQMSQYEEIASGEAGSDSVEARIARNMEEWFVNPWQMIADQVIYTLDSTNILDPIKPFPPYPWLERTTAFWMTDRLILIPKSRRLMYSWLMIFLHLHLAMFNEGAQVFFVSDKEEKSDELVKRAEFILKYIPDDTILKPKYKGTYCFLEFPGLNSYIHGLPMGAGQLRQYTATAIFADEFAFWKLARETYMASIPTIQGGGRFTGVSSPLKGFFKDMVFDQIR